MLIKEKVIICEINKQTGLSYTARKARLNANILDFYDIEIDVNNILIFD